MSEGESEYLKQWTKGQVAGRWKIQMQQIGGHKEAEQEGMQTAPLGPTLTGGTDRWLA